jgi:hypothetical protein
VFLGILPLLLTVRAWQARERLAIVATIACGVALIVVIAALSR